MKSNPKTSSHLIACIAAFAISTPLLQAQLNVTFNGDGDKTVASGTITPISPPSGPAQRLLQGPHPEPNS